jgi:alcohol dehydrogenase class IV
MDAFRYTSFDQQVIFGPGALAELGAACEHAGWRRVMVCATASARARGQLAAIEAALGERLVAAYEDVRPHVPQAQVDATTDLADAHAVDAVIGLGGGSAIGTAKAASRALDQRRAERYGSRVAGAPVVVVAIPTTYAGSEMTPVYGVTRLVEGAPRKLTTSDPLAVPRLVLYDPLLTLDLPPRVAAGTGINAAAHCVEALYSITRNPLATAAALAGLRAIAHALPICYAAGDDRAARARMLEGAYLAGTALAGVKMGLHHGICHVLGGVTGAAHGDLNAVMLPHVMRFNLDAAAPQLALATAALGVATAGMGEREAAEQGARAVAGWAEDMRLPTRLRDLGVRAEQLPELAALGYVNTTVRNNPRPIQRAAEIETLLRAAW